MWSRLRRPPARVDHLHCITDACKDGSVGLISLNHDTVLEQALRHDGVSFKDGFTISVSDDLDAWNNDFDAHVQLFKLHGSVAVSSVAISLDPPPAAQRVAASDRCYVADPSRPQDLVPASGAREVAAGLDTQAPRRVCALSEDVLRCEVVVRVLELERARKSRPEVVFGNAAERKQRLRVGKGPAPTIEALRVWPLAN